MKKSQAKTHKDFQATEHVLDGRFFSRLTFMNFNKLGISITKNIPEYRRHILGEQL